VRHRFALVLKRPTAFRAGTSRRSSVPPGFLAIADRSLGPRAIRRSGWLFSALLCLIWAVCGCGGYVVKSTSETVQLAVSESALAFGAVPLQTKSTKTLTLTSSGTATLTISSLSLAGTGFDVSGAAFPTTLETGQSVALQVTFNPTVAGVASGALTISSTASDGGTATVSLSGSGTSLSTSQLTASASSLDFGNVTLNTASTQTLTLTSSGTAPVTINSAAIAGSGFAISGATFPVTLNPGKSATLQVKFDPVVVGAATGTITISSNSALGATSVIALSGTGVASGSPQLTLSSSSLAFGSVALNTTSAKTLTLTSAGTAALTVNSVSLVGARFSVSGAVFPTVLNPGQTLSIQVSFNPTVIGAASGTLAISSNSTTGSTILVALSGSGTTATTPQLTLSTSALAFGNVTLNSTLTKTLTLTSSGTAPVTVNSATLSGAGFSIKGMTFPTTLNPGQSVTLQVSFKPTVAGASNGTITISSNSSVGSSATVSLSGAGVSSTNPVLTLSAATLNFGDDPVGTPATMQLTLTSTGTSPVTVSSASITGAGFTFSGATFPVTLNPTIAISIQVKFTPTTVGAATGTLTFASNSSSGSTNVVNLIGTGTAVQHQVTLNWAAPVGSPVPVTGYNVYRAPGGSSSFQILNSSSISQTTYIDLTVQTKSVYVYYVKSVDAAGAESTPSNEVTVTVP